VQYNGG